MCPIGKAESGGKPRVLARRAGCGGGLTRRSAAPAGQHNHQEWSVETLGWPSRQSTKEPMAQAESSLLRNHTFDELRLGTSASLTRTVGDDDIALFAAVSGDVNPAHMDPAFAANERFGHVVVHGM